MIMTLASNYFDHVFHTCTEIVAYGEAGVQLACDNRFSILIITLVMLGQMASHKLKQQPIQKRCRMYNIPIKLFATGRSFTLQGKANLTKHLTV